VDNPKRQGRRLLHKHLAPRGSSTSKSIPGVTNREVVENGGRDVGAQPGETVWPEPERENFLQERVELEFGPPGSSLRQWPEE